MQNEPQKENSKTSKRLRKEVPKRKINSWKIAFFILVGFLLGTTLFLYTRLSSVREVQFEETKQEVRQNGEPVLQANMTKKQLNALIDYSLQEFLDNSKVQYHFYLENQALFNGTFSVLGAQMQFYLYFDPYVLENGNIELQAKSLSIGTLSLPILEIMNYIKNSYDLPEWVEVNPKKKTITLNLQKLTLQNGMYVRAKKINLIDDDIRLELYLPKNEQKEE